MAQTKTIRIRMAQANTTKKTKTESEAVEKGTVRKETGAGVASKSTADNSNSSSNYDAAVSTLIIHTRSNRDTQRVISAYKYDKTDPIGYNPILSCCNTAQFPSGSLQMLRCNSSYEVFEKSSQFGGAKDRNKYRRYNNSHNCVELRRPLKLSDE